MPLLIIFFTFELFDIGLMSKLAASAILHVWLDFLALHENIGQHAEACRVSRKVPRQCTKAPI